MVINKRLPDTERHKGNENKKYKKQSRKIEYEKAIEKDHRVCVLQLN